jgi:hypothetical protein
MGVVGSKCEELLIIAHIPASLSITWLINTQKSIVNTGLFQPILPPFAITYVIV